jgi:hypothetical protein
MSVAITHQYHIPTGKNYLTGLRQEGYDQWKLTVTAPQQEQVIFFRTSLTPRHRFAIATRAWSASSFEELIRVHSNCNKVVHEINPNRMVFDNPILSDAEIQEATQQWLALQAEASA